MTYCMQCGNQMDGGRITCPGCNSKADEFYARPLRDLDSKRENIMKARKQYIRGEYADAVSLLSDIGIKEPKNINILYSLGMSLSKTKDYSRAMQVYGRALSIKPDSVNILYAKGLCYMDLGDHKEARKFFARSLELEPMFKNSREMMKKCSEELGKQHDDIVHEQMKELIQSRTVDMPGDEAYGVTDEAVSLDGTETYRCGICGEIPMFEDQYQMWWCDGCSRYIEEGILEPYDGYYEEEPQAEWAEEYPQYPCKTCGTMLKFIDEYQRWWCDGCRNYVGGDTGSPAGTGDGASSQATASKSTVPKAGGEQRCDDCGGELRFIEQYQMLWCDKCEKYLGEDDGGKKTKAAEPVSDGPPTYPCRRCGNTLVFVEQYQKWWCDGCHQYV